MSSLDKITRQLLWGESRRVPQSVKTKVRKRTKGRCEYPRCKKRPREFHHWRDPATERTTAFLCHKHHADKGHNWKTETDILGNRHPDMVSRKRIPIPQRTKPRRTRTRKRR
jgi:hypothetical protein